MYIVKKIADFRDLNYTAAFILRRMNMVRISKQAQKRQRFPRKSRYPSEKTGTLKDNLPEGFKPHANAVEGDLAKMVFIPKIK
jgi:hypothetical protein